MNLSALTPATAFNKATDAVAIIQPDTTSPTGFRTRKLPLSYLYAALASASNQIIAIKAVSNTDHQITDASPGYWQAITGLTITHTLSSATNKILLFGSVFLVGESNEAGGAGLAFFRTLQSSGSVTKVGCGYHGVSGVQTELTSAVPLTNNSYCGATVPFNFVDDPGSLNPVTYTAKFCSMNNQSGINAYVNRSPADGNNILFPSGISTMTLMEVVMTP